MKLVWYCSFCKKKVEKKPRLISNTLYVPDVVFHKHRGIKYILTCMTFDEWMRNPKYKGY